MTADLPIWLPPLVKESAREAYRSPSFAAARATVKRVTTDPDMAGVWKYLQKKKRRDKGRRTADYEYPAIDPMAAKTDHHPEAFPSRAEWMQQTALCKIYERMLFLGRIWASAESAEEPSRFSADWYRRQRAAELRLEAQTLSDKGAPHLRALRLRAASHLIRAADCFDAMAEGSISFAVKTTPTAVIADTARHMTALFGTPLYSQSAVISGVVLDREVTRQQVRDSCCGLWGKSAKKTKKSPTAKI